MNGRASIISVITTPLGFFALSLLIVESFLATVLVLSNNLPNPAKELGIWVAAVAFFVVIGLVTLLVWCKPLNLTLQGKEWNERAKDLKDWGDSTNPQTKKEVENLPLEVNQTRTVRQNAT